MTALQNLPNITYSPSLLLLATLFSRREKIMKALSMLQVEAWSLHGAEDSLPAPMWQHVMWEEGVTYLTIPRSTMHFSLLLIVQQSSKGTKGRWVCAFEGSSNYGSLTLYYTRVRMHKIFCFKNVTFLFFFWSWSLHVRIYAYSCCRHLYLWIYLIAEILAFDRFNSYDRQIDLVTMAILHESFNLVWKKKKHPGDTSLICLQHFSIFASFSNTLLSDVTRSKKLLFHSQITFLTIGSFSLH